MSFLLQIFKELLAIPNFDVVDEIHSWKRSRYKKYRGSAKVGFMSSLFISFSFFNGGFSCEIGSPKVIISL